MRWIFRSAGVSEQAMLPKKCKKELSTTKWSGAEKQSVLVYSFIFTAFSFDHMYSNAY